MERWPATRRSTSQPVGNQENDLNNALGGMRAVGVKASGDEFDDHDLRALWQRASALTPRSARPPL